MLRGVGEGVFGGQQGFIQQPLSWNIIHFDGSVARSRDPLNWHPSSKDSPVLMALGAHEYLRTQAIR